jgi:hypothetical protein
MCQRLVVALGKLGRYDCFELQTQIELEFIARRAPAEEVRQTAADALAALQRGKHRPVSEVSPAFLNRVTRQACSLIASATTGKAARNGKPLGSVAAGTKITAFGPPPEEGTCGRRAEPRSAHGND